MRKRIFALITLFFFATAITGCDALQRKFTRKKKPAPKVPKIVQVKKYENRPTPELYKKRFSYWASWQSELASVLGQNSKKDARCAEEIMSNLLDMQAFLVKEKAEEMQPHIDKMAKVRDDIVKGEVNPLNRDYYKRVLDREAIAIKKKFVYSKVKEYFRKSFNDESTQSG